MEKRLAAANDLREAEKFGESSQAYTECLLDLADGLDPAGLIHCLGGQSLIYKNLLSVKDAPLLRRLCLYFANEAQLVAEKAKASLDHPTLAVAYRCFGNALFINKDFPGALVNFEKALALISDNRPESGYLKSHIGSLKYLLGDKPAGVAILLEALTDIRSGDQDSFVIRVWETGALNTLAKIYFNEGQKEKAIEIFKQSLEVATTHNLPIRKRETEEIIAKINSGQTDFSL